MKSNFPRIPFLHGWEGATGMLEIECIQSLDEGRDPASVEKIETQIAALAPTDHAALADCWYALQEIPVRPDYPYNEPSDLESIRASTRANRPLPTLTNLQAALPDRMLGAWLGRSIGCALGKPVECFMGSHGSLSSKDRIKTYLTAIDPAEYPIRDYFPAASPASSITGVTGCAPSTREKIAFMETDDDIRYTVLGQIILQKCGAAFTSADVAKAWMEYLGYTQVCTAETQAYRNLVIRYGRTLDPGADAGVDWDWVATHQNPYREWIGAQIRADSWGYAAPGNPALAAEFAWRDARISHVKNGIYGEMFCAAMIAAGFATTDPLQVIEAGLAQIPARSRLWLEMRETIEICRAHEFRAAEFEAVLEEIYARFGHYHPVHTNNNAALVVAALLLGRDDFEKVVTIAVMGGWDTDCNGATAGSIWGAMFGAALLPKKWTAPLNDTLFSFIPGYHPIPISECARRSVEIATLLAAKQ